MERGLSRGLSRGSVAWLGAAAVAAKSARSSTLAVYAENPVTAYTLVAHDRQRKIASLVFAGETVSEER